MSTEFTEQIIREAPEIEAYKLALLRDARGLASQPAGLQQYDADGKPIMESYDTGEVDADGNPIMGQRPQILLPRQQIADMSDLQKTALQQAQSGIGSYQPYMTGATNTLGAAQGTMTNALANAQPYQSRAAEYLDAAGLGVAGQVSGAQTGIANALTSGIGATTTAQTGMDAAALGARNIAGQGIADQLAAYDSISGQVGAAQQGMGQAGLAAGQVAQGVQAGTGQVVGQLGAGLAGTDAASRAAAARAGGQLDQSTAQGQRLAQSGDRRLMDTTAGMRQSATASWVKI